MCTFLDQTGSHWLNGTLISSWPAYFWHILAHHGMLIAGLPNSAPELTDTRELLTL